MIKSWVRKLGLVGGMRDRRTVPVTVYSRQGCGCCDKALAALQAAGDRHPLAVEVVDVDGDPELKERYGMEVPVVLIDGKVRFRGLINPALLERLLRAEGAGQGG